MSGHKRAMLVEIARGELTNRPTEHDADPKRYEPPDWLIAALEQAYDRGLRDGHRAAGAGLYPEGG